MKGPILLLTIDALRNDRFSPDCIPQWSGDFVWFKKAYSHGVATPFAFPGIIAGEVPSGDGTVPESIRTLAERFPERQSAGFGNNPHLLFRRGYNRGFDLYHHAVPPDEPDPAVIIDWMKRVGRKLPGNSYLKKLSDRISAMISNKGLASPSYTDAKSVRRFVERQLERDPDAFIWSHFMEPHFPFDPKGVVGEPSLPSPTEISDNLNGFINNRNFNRHVVSRLYDENVKYLIHNLDDLFTNLSDRGIYKDSMIVLTSDHGELFGEHGRTAHPWDGDPYDELIRVPLLVKYPGNKSGGEQRNYLVQHSDIAATICSEVDKINGSDRHFPLSKRNQRYPISVSNTTVRVSGPKGSIIRRKNGEIVRRGKVTDEMEERAKEFSIPSIPHLSGEVAAYPNVSNQSEVVEDELEERLEDLGYK